MDTPLAGIITVNVNVRKLSSPVSSLIYIQWLQLAKCL